MLTRIRQTVRRHDASFQRVIALWRKGEVLWGRIRDPIEGALLFGWLCFIIAMLGSTKNSISAEDMTRVLFGVVVISSIFYLAMQIGRVSREGKREFYDNALPYLTLVFVSLLYATHTNATLSAWFYGYAFVMCIYWVLKFSLWWNRRDRLDS